MLGAAALAGAGSPAEEEEAVAVQAAEPARRELERLRQDEDRPGAAEIRRGSCCW